VRLPKKTKNCEPPWGSQFRFSISLADACLSAFNGSRVGYAVKIIKEVSVGHQALYVHIGSTIDDLMRSVKMFFSDFPSAPESAILQMVNSIFMQRAVMARAQYP
jgi:hypothetical protein